METKEKRAIISEYMSKLGKKGGKLSGARNLLRGKEYFSKISAKEKPWKRKSV
jgi:hypothetical protein